MREKTQTLMEEPMTQIISKAAGALEAVVTMAITMLVSVFILALVAFPQSGVTETASYSGAAKVTLAASSQSPDRVPDAS
jgi:hypothetical protein